MRGGRGVPKNTNARRPRYSFFQYLQLLGSEFSEQHRKPGDIPARPREARDVSEADRVSMDREHDRDRLGRLSGSLDTRRRHRKDDVDIHAHQLGSQFRQLVGPFRPPELDENVSALDPAEVAQSAPQHLKPARPRRCWGQTQKPDPRYLGRLLCARGNRPCDRRAKDQGDEVPPPHTMTSSALPNERALELLISPGPPRGAVLHGPLNWPA